jgi:nickel transport protein
MNRSNLRRNLAIVAKGAVLFLLVALYAAMPAPDALAHNVLLSAYVEGDRVVVESGFSDGTLCDNAKLEIFDPSGKKLLEGRTDKNGEFSFVPTQKTDLKLVLDAGMGHRAEYTVPAGELPEIAASPKGKAAVPAKEPRGTAALQKAGPAAAQPVSKVQKSQTSPAGAVAGVDAEEIEAIVDRVVKERLRPLTQLVAKSQRKTGVSPTEVLGGIGYILGLMGIAMYVRYRKSGKP